MSALSGSTASAKRRLASVYSWPQYTRVASGSAAKRDSEACICSAVPSNSRPQPAENRVSPQNSMPPPTIGDVPGGVARDIEHVEFEAEFGNTNMIAILEPVREGGDALARRAVHRDGIMFQNIRHAAHVIAVMVGAEDGGGREALFFQRRQHRIGVAGVDNGHPVRGFPADQPYIVVGEGADV